MTFAERLDREMRRRRLSAEALSRETGLSARTVCLYRSGERLPRMDSLARICDALGTSMDEMAGRGAVTLPVLGECE